MRDVLNRSNRPARFGHFLLPAAALLLIVGGGLAQGPNAKPATPEPGTPSVTPRRVAATPHTQPAGPSDTDVIQIIQMQYASAPELARVLGGQTQSGRVTPDERTNSLIVNGPREDVARLRDLVQRLDAAPTQPNRAEIKTYRLTNRQADNNLSSLLQSALGLCAGSCPGGRQGGLAMDPLRGLVIVSGGEDIQLEVRGLLKELDTPAEAPAHAPAPSISKIRIALLLTGPEAKIKGLPEVPATLKDAAAEVGRILGSEPPRLLAQCMIDTSGGDNFEMNTSVTGLMAEPCKLSITGKIDVYHGKPSLDLKITAFGAPLGSPPPRSPVPGPDLAIRTMIAAEPGQDLVLGVSPTGDMASAFVVRILK